MKLETLLAPISKEDFLNQYWEKQPLHIPRDDPEYFAELLSLARLDYLLGYAAAAKVVKLTSRKDGKNADTAQLKGAPGRLAKIYERFYQGATIILDGVNELWEPVAHLCAQLVKDLEMDSVVNLYVTPRNSEGFDFHWDDHDVMVFQIAGEKHWFLNDSGPLLPQKPEDPQLESQVGLDPSAPSRELTLKPGDFLYLPRGTWHRAKALDGASMHLTVGFVTRTWEHLLCGAMAGLAEKHMPLRKTLPIGWQQNPERIAAGRAACRTALADLLEPSHLGDTLELFSKDFVESLPVLPDGHFPRLDREHEIGPRTVLTKRSGSLLVIRREAEQVRMFFPGFSQTGPEKLGWAFEFMKSASDFAVEDIPGWFSLKEKILLVKHLLRKGFLTVVAASEAKDGATTAIT